MPRPRKKSVASAAPIQASPAPSAPPDAELRKILLELERRRKYRAMDFFEPYPKQREFFKLGATYPERMFFAGNQIGKTTAGAFEVACHMTGMYPDWWQGRRWGKATKGWVCGKSSQVVRDVQQKQLCGEPGVDALLGTGMIPKECFSEKPSPARGIDSFMDTISVRHVSGGTSIAKLKTYEQGWEKFQGDTVDWFWCDEEPDMRIYMECLTRIAHTDGMGFTTFTPLAGATELVRRFRNEESKKRAMLTMTIDDVPWSDEKKAEHIARYPAYLRGAKLYGVPMMGEGAVFDCPEDSLREAALPVEQSGHWPRLWGLDFGFSHPFAAVLIGWDKDSDIVHVLHTIRMKDARPVDHAKAMKGWGIDIPVAWPHDGDVRDRGSLVPLSKLYKAEGLKMLDSHAAWPDGSISTETGIVEMDDRMKSGGFKVAAHLADWFEEYRGYHRKDGLLVKEDDDLMSATRIAIMAKRFARVSGRGAGALEQRGPRIVPGVDGEHWGL